MGLSDPERIKGLYFAVEAIVKKGRGIRSCIRDFQMSDYKYLLESIDKLWHALLGGNSNPGHWCIGSSSTNEVRWDTLTPWGVSITTRCNGIDLPDEKKDSDDTFNAFDGFLDIPGLLMKAGREFNCVYEVFSWTEQATYYLRRYDDELSKSLEKLSSVISDIQGECFTLFRSSYEYSAAYVMNQIFKMIYGDHYPYRPDKWDVLTKHIQEEHIHHKLSRMMDVRQCDLKKLAEIHIRLYRAKKQKKLSLIMRVEAMLELCGKSYHYEDILKKLPINKAERARAMIILKKNQKLHEDYENLLLEDYEDSVMSPLSIYGATHE